MNLNDCNRFDERGYRSAALETAMHRLGQYIDAEQETLSRVLAQANRRQADASLEKIMQLHLLPNCRTAELRQLLEEAEAALQFIFETL